MATKITEAERHDAINDLLAILAPGDTIYTRLDHVSKSGMMRIITPLLLRVDVVTAFNKGERRGPDHRLINLDESTLTRYYLGWLTHKAVGFGINDDHGIRMSGAGMDMGFHLVYTLSYTLFPDGFDCIGEKCTSNDHSNYRDTACALCGRAMCPCGRFPTAEGKCPECGHDAVRYYAWQFQGESVEHDGCRCEPPTPRYTRKSRGSDAAVCSQACASAVWHHSDGGYALSHHWL